MKINIKINITDFFASIFLSNGVKEIELSFEYSLPQY